MKKYKVCYEILFFISGLMVFSLGFGYTIITNQYNDYLDYGVIDGWNGATYYSVANFVLKICLILGAMKLFKERENNLKNKKLLTVLLCYLALLIPIGVSIQSGGYRRTYFCKFPFI